MKKLYYAFFAAALTASCSDDDTATQHKPLNPGSEVSFNLSLSDSKPSTRTIYGDEGEKTPNAFPIYWVQGDQVAMAAPGAAVETATYTIDVEKEDQNFATSMTKVGDAGIQWGTEFPQNFYSVYPYKYTDIDGTTIENKFTINGKEAVANLHIRQTQRQKFTYDETTSTWEGTPVGEQGMKYPDAIMYAQKQMTKTGDVALRYIPFTTAFNITLNGLDYVGTEDPNDPNPIVIQEVIIEAPENVKLVGDFTAKFDGNATNAPSVSNITNASNIIQIPCLVDETRYLHLKDTKQKINFNVFAIPNNNENIKVTDAWKLHVVTNYDTYTRKLTPASENSGQLIAGQVHKLVMPKIFINKDNIKLDAKTWMKYIPRNVYITDISLPGAWYSRQSEYQGTDNGSAWTIQALWDKGVRAFSVETRTCTNATEIRYDSTPAYVGISGSGKNQAGLLGGAYFYGATNVADIMEAVCGAVRGGESGATAKRYGYAVLTFSYADGGTGGHRQQDYNFWLEGLYKAYNSLLDEDKEIIYGSKGEKITPSTTIGDVAGRVILRVNVASGLPGKDANQYLYSNDGKIHIGNYNGELPALLTYVNREREPGTAPVSMMHWKEWDDSFMQNVGIFVNDNDNESDALDALKKLGSENFYCNYSVANRTNPIDDESTLAANKLPTYTGRKKALSRILRNSALSLQLGNHNLWSLFAAGGTEADDSDDKNPDPVAFAVNMNSWILKQLNDRIASGKYGPFGNVFCNYIATTATSNGVTVDGNEIIERILRMNQLFRLSRDEDKPEWPDNGGGTSTPSAASYSSTLSKDANGWNAY